MKLNIRSDFYDLQLLIGRTMEIKARGGVIGLCHGCFDVVHFGHLIHFEEASSVVDFLVVSLTSDRFVSKGPNRPIFNESRRAYFLSNIRTIDEVFINDAPTSINVINTIMPNIYFKGGDYIDSDSMGLRSEVDAVNLYGGRVEFTNGDRFSTSETLRLLGI
jgi:rfaE bifunctional protein nucleotidyltransferase chain/domain